MKSSPAHAGELFAARRERRRRLLRNRGKSKVFPRTSAQRPQHYAIHHAGQCAVDDHRAGNDEHFGRHAGDEALCLCQDRTHIFLFFSNYRIQSNGNQLFLLKGLSSGPPCNCFYDFLGEIIMTPEVNLYSSIFIDTDLLYQFPKFFWAVPIQKLNTLGICF